MKLPTVSPNVNRKVSSIGLFKGLSISQFRLRRVSRPPIFGGGVLSVACCGTVDSDTMTGTNCHDISTTQKCAGDILACPNGEVIDQNGNAWCA